MSDDIHKQVDAAHGAWRNATESAIVELTARNAELLGLLREIMDEHDLEHDIRCKIHAPRTTGLEKRECSCGTWDFEARVRKAIGEGDG